MPSSLAIVYLMYAAKLHEFHIVRGKPDREIRIAEMTHDPVHRVAKKLLEVVRLGQAFAEIFLDAHGVHLPCQFSIRRDEIVAEQIDFFLIPGAQRFT